MKTMITKRIKLPFLLSAMAFLSPLLDVIVAYQIKIIVVKGIAVLNKLVVFYYKKKGSSWYQKTKIANNSTVNS